MVPITLVLSLLACRNELADSGGGFVPTVDDLGGLANAVPSPTGEARRGAATLSLIGQPHYGQQVVFRVTGANPGERVYFVYGTRGQGQGICPGPLGGECLDVVSPVTVFAQVNANGSGVADAPITLPPQGPDGFVVTFQAAIPRGPGGADSVLTNVLNVSVTFDNEVPDANNDTYSVTEDQLLTVDAANGVLDNDTDPDGDPLEAVLVSTTSHGVLILNPDGSFNYNSNLNYAGSDSFTYRADDGITLSPPATVNITVTAVNDAPNVEDDNYNQGIIEDTVFVQNAAGGVLANDGPDPEGNPFTAVIHAQPNDYDGGGLVVLNPDGSFQFTPAADYEGETYFQYRAVDSGGASSSPVPVRLNVHGRNDDPRPGDDLYVIDRDELLQPVAPGLLANDVEVDGDYPLTVTGVGGGGQQQHGQLQLFANGSFNYLPELCFRGLDTFEYLVDDSTGRTGRGYVTIEIGEFTPPDPGYCDLWEPVGPDFVYDNTPFQGQETWTAIPNNPIGLVFAFHPGGGAPSGFKGVEETELWNDLYNAGVGIVAFKSEANGWDNVTINTNNPDYKRARDLRQALIQAGEIANSTPLAAWGFSSGAVFTGVFAEIGLDQGLPITSILVHAGAFAVDPNVPAFFWSGENDTKVPPSEVLDGYNRHSNPNKVFRLKPEERVHELEFIRHPDISHQLSYDSFQSLIAFGGINANGDRVYQGNLTQWLDDWRVNTPTERAAQVAPQMKASWAVHWYSSHFKDEEVAFILNFL